MIRTPALEFLLWSSIVLGVTMAFQVKVNGANKKCASELRAYKVDAPVRDFVLRSTLIRLSFLF